MSNDQSEQEWRTVLD